MSEAYEEIIQTEAFYRRSPAPAHEVLVDRLHRHSAAALPLNSALRLLPPPAHGADAGRAHPRSAGYHGGAHHALTDPGLPGLHCPMDELFAKL